MSLSDDGEGSDVVSNGEIEICKSLLHDCIRLVVAVTTNSEGFDDCICAVFVISCGLSFDGGGSPFGLCCLPGLSVLCCFLSSFTYGGWLELTVQITP